MQFCWQLQRGHVPRILTLRTLFCETSVCVSVWKLSGEGRVCKPLPAQRWSLPLCVFPSVCSWFTQCISLIRLFSLATCRTAVGWAWTPRGSVRASTSRVHRELMATQNMRVSHRSARTNGPLQLLQRRTQLPADWRSEGPPIRSNWPQPCLSRSS